MGLQLDNNERAYLNAYQAEDPKAEHWICPWVLGPQGADAVGLTFTGSIAVARRLTQRKLLEGEPGARGTHRGYAITGKGRKALST